MQTSILPPQTEPPFDPVVPPEGGSEPIDWTRLFRQTGTVEIDIGSGKGMFLIESALARPDVNFVGIEPVGKPFHIARERIMKRGLTNVRLVQADARVWIAERVAESSVDAHYIQFPDPWPKKKHHKRRVVTPDFVAQLARTLKSGGTLLIATDIADYFDELAWIIESNPTFHLLEEGGFDPSSQTPTNFAAKYRQQGRDMYQAQFICEKT